MALYSTVKGIIDDEIYSNGVQYITGPILNAVLDEIVDAVGARQVYVNPATTDNPGTPENPRVYVCLPGTYTNFLTAAATPAVITAPIGFLIWDGGPYWTATQFPIPSAYDYFQCQTSAAMTSGTPYTTIGVTMSNGGWTAKAGQWVQFVNRRTGVYDFVQLTADVADDDTAITFKSWTIQENFPAGSIVEVNPMVNMMWHGDEGFGDGTNNYITWDTSWRFPPQSTTTDPGVWLQHVIVEINGMPGKWVSGTPSAPFEYKMNASTGYRMEFADVLTSADRVTVRLWQPRKIVIVA